MSKSVETSSVLSIATRLEPSFIRRAASNNRPIDRPSKSGGEWGGDDAYTA
jgi:hypothetical protein